MGWFGDIFDTIKSPGSPYPETYSGFPKDLDDWTAYNFINYYEANRNVVGHVQAERYLYGDIDKIHPWATLYNDSYDCYILDYWQSTFGKMFPGTDAPIGTALCGGKEAVGTGVDIVTGITKTAKILTSPAFLITGVVLVGSFFAWPYIQPLLKKKKRGRS